MQQGEYLVLSLELTRTDIKNAMRRKRIKPTPELVELVILRLYERARKAAQEDLQAALQELHTSTKRE